MKTTQNGRENPKPMAAPPAAAKPVSGQTTTSSPRGQSSKHGCILPVPMGDLRTGRTVADLKQSFLDTLFCTLGRVPTAATPHDLYTALALAIRDRVLKQRVQTRETYDDRVAVDHKNQQEETCNSE
jgi:starch phosphorylase